MTGTTGRTTARTPAGMMSQGVTWTNWAGNESADHIDVVRCGSTADVVAVVTAAREAGRRVRPIGAGHSFTAVGTPADVQLDLGAMTGLVAYDGDGRVRVRAGTRLAELNRLLAEVGLAMANLGDIDVQTVAGAISTGTHGTGARLPGLAGLVTGLQLVLADGSVVEASRVERPDLFDAARVGLGAFGVVTEVELACVPAFRCEAVEAPMSVRDVRRELDDLVDGSDHFEFFWFPGTDSVLTKRNRRLAPGDPAGRELSPLRYHLEDELLSNDVFGLTCRLATAVPSLTGPINRVAAKALGARTYTGDSHAVFASPRTVRFTESEYAVPRSAVLDVLADLSAWLVRTPSFRTPFPIEVRFAASDDAWLSTGYERANAYVAVHQYHRLDIGPCLAAFEDIVARYEGRPHWGKLHTLGAERLAELYPRFADARRVRDDVDPDRIFGNAHLEHVLG